MEFLQPFLAPMCLGALVLVVAQFFWVALLNKRLERQSRMVRQFFQGPSGEDLEGLLRRSMEVAEQSANSCENWAGQLAEIEARQRGCLQYFSVVRYDAFEDVTGQQSFSMALLDGSDNGVVVTAIFGRSSSRTFGKLITGGQAEQSLSSEEQEALLQALERKVERGTSREKVSS
jgi:hypothetical protein